ncbi:undecaprenyldiphospho-muramoylpentapeptide beta-N-acetylglucosaminyltransferase [Helicobacter cappadocius]|uniref:UDP-N-acetylglucosamine--N-acetylmuramyl-(pentapeptide) pyrophosphoryl-undecaprenol N-acetylglucosamine transferase n=1 Tax=Helicobacter cappadocius TaxID=3063998 RepID=A0AA90T4E5_9HELI|nr:MULTISPECIES: undecaprenyldiphospho-muramoylpentapeptide beta-N-acetylglucosaminyltransferase [unclassified Helicobacter]MDO7252356.1 undecaprenyldiphospho-muramoylpentapeptide beta-N-acetylglucosaminyltransferase [Helicobacter sp. faydin-H75]MDP2538223.1 undecaprenyldiphospho-muramoylpentapeptide beta-N-acetylglucosaminyltransferase [Helicobacter sp. faydin-H76]
MNIVITGGGTGGHLAIARALGEEFKSLGNKVIYIGSTSGQDRDWFAQNDLFEKCYFLDTTGVVNKKGLGLIVSLWKQLIATLKAKKIFKLHKIHSVVSVGGFSAGPASIATIGSKIPLFIHEQNAIKGTLNKYLSKYSKATFGSFSLIEDGYIKTFYPLRSDFFARARVRKELKCVIFLGGSQGASALNDFALLVAKTLLEKGIRIIHQCGENDFKRVKNIYKTLDILDFIDLFAFDKELVNKIIEADMCISRAGASSVWELAANGLPTLYVPYPYATGDHQYHNALEFTKEELGKVVRQNELSPEVLFEFMSELESLDENGIIKLKDISARLQSKISQGGAMQIAKEVIERSNR